MYVSGAGWRKYADLTQATKEKLALLSVLDPLQQIDGVGYRQSEKTFRIDWEDYCEF